MRKNIMKMKELSDEKLVIESQILIDFRKLTVNL